MKGPLIIHQIVLYARAQDIVALRSKLKTYWKCNFLMSRLVVGWSACHYLLKGRKVTLTALVFKRLVYRGVPLTELSIYLFLISHLQVFRN